MVGGDLTCVAWNHAVDPFMFATGSHDGAVRIWTTASASSQPSPYPEVLVSAPTTAPASRAPSPYPPDPELRTESPNSMNRSDLITELRNSLVADHPRVNFR